MRFYHQNTTSIKTTINNLKCLYKLRALGASVFEKD